ncbi:MAG: hypothetical protein JXP48_05170 [Acidobacteria bacterium]|nr:hypothetical protein [Acidobacteriota bacterium]
MQTMDEKPAAPKVKVTGLNDNLDFLGTPLHVQTESLELPEARIVTQVFSKGRILFSRKSGIPPEIRLSGDPEPIRALMRSQHSSVLGEIADKQKRIQAKP